MHLAALPGLNCWLAHTRASMARIVAGLSVDMHPQSFGDTVRAFSYPDGYHPPNCFGPTTDDSSDDSSTGDNSPAGAGPGPGPRAPPADGASDGYASDAGPGAAGGYNSNHAGQR